MRRKKQIVHQRRLIAAGAGAVVLALAVILVLLLRQVPGMVADFLESMKEPYVPRYNGEPVSVEEYINDQLDRPAVAWNLMLVSEKYPLAEGYVPVLATVRTRWQVDERIADATEQMLNACRDEGMNPIICSAYRSVDYQEELFEDRMARSRASGLEDSEARNEASEIVAVPGSSEHHTGLALDIVSYDYQLLDEGQEQTPENQWLREHCAEYGFILRFPPGKTEETGIIYEPWHFRYVGKEAAAEIMERGITLEEYLGAL